MIRSEKDRSVCFQADMKKEYEAGNYVLCGGDFNHDLKAAEDDDSTDRESWAYPFPRNMLPEHFFLYGSTAKERKSVE